MVCLDVLTLESTLLAPPHGRPLSEVSSGMCQYWGVSYSELLLKLLEKDKTRREAIGAPSFKGLLPSLSDSTTFSLDSPRHQHRHPPVRLRINSSFLSTRKSEVAAAQTWLAATARILGWGERKQEEG